jgi:indolepyruvate ferredoxin oxidoreductase
VLRLLRWGKRLRGTPLDFFSRTRLRRMEHALIRRYEALLASLCGKLSAANYADAVKLAALPDMVRGYKATKLGLPWPEDDVFAAIEAAP